MLSLFTVDTGPYKRQKFGYRKRTAPCKLTVQLTLVKERLNLIVRPIIIKPVFKVSVFHFARKHCLVFFIRKTLQVFEYFFSVIQNVVTRTNTSILIAA